MIAIFLKELREHAKWAGVIAVALGVVILVAARTVARYGSPMLLFQLSEGQVLLCSALAGLFLGLSHRGFPHLTAIAGVHDRAVISYYPARGGPYRSYHAQGFCGATGLHVPVGAAIL